MVPVATLNKRSIGTMDPPYSAAFNAALDMVARDAVPVSPQVENTEPCTMGVGCDEAGVCYAAAHGAPEQCPASPIATSVNGAGVREDRYTAGYVQGQADATQMHEWMQDKAWQDAVLMLVHYRTLAERTWLVGHDEALSKLAEWWKRAGALAETKSAADIAALSPALDNTVAPEPWWTDAGSVAEARRVFQEGRRALLHQKSINTHLRGVYEPIIAALEPMLSTLAVLDTGKAAALDNTAVEGRDRARMAAFTEIAGENPDPFIMPESYDFACKVADAVIATLTAETEKAR